MPLPHLLRAGAFVLALSLAACGGFDTGGAVEDGIGGEVLDASDIASIEHGSAWAQKTAAPDCPSPTAALADITAVQGPGARSPLEGSVVAVRGVVTADQRGEGQFGGFYIQQLERDDDPATSEGLFVFAPASTSQALAVGDYVQVEGPVLEFQRSGDSQPLTQIANPTAITVCGTARVPRATRLTLPLPSPDQFERYEGMRVRIGQPLIVSGNFTLGRFGELVVSSQQRLYHPNNHPTLAPDAARDLNARSRLVIDDGSNLQNPAPIPYLTSAGTDGTRRAGDVLQRGAEGVLTWAFDSWRLQPTAALTFAARNPRPASPAPQGATKVASLNVLNYFTTLGQRGANDAAELQRQQDKLVATIVEMNPDVLGLIEIENNGPVALRRLVEALNARVGEARFAFRDAGVPGTDAIKVAAIYQSARVTAVGNPFVPTDPDFAVDGGLRPPVAQRFVAANGGGFWFVVNHFKSKGSCPSSATSPDADNGQGCWNAARVRQANALVRWVDTLVAASGETDVLLAGDFNAYLKEDPIATLRAASYENLLDRLPATERYSYVFDGEAGALDHAFASASLRTQVRGVAPWHSNADEPVVLDYNLESKTDDRYAPTPWRASDHDPIIVALDLAADAPVSAPTLEAPLPANGTAGQPVEITDIRAQLATGAGGRLEIDWGDGTDVQVLPADSITASHVYAQAGAYTLRMRLVEGDLLPAELVATVTVSPGTGSTTGLYISEYVEGTSNNKALEIHNPSSDPADLSAYTLQIFFNGATTPGQSLALTGTLAPGAVLVIHNPAFAIPGYTLPPGALPWGGLSFNGDDALVLLRDGAVADQFGQVGFDPGSAWESDTLSTLDRTLRRKPGVDRGSVPPAAPTAWDLTIEWEGLAVNTVDGLGVR